MMNGKKVCFATFVSIMMLLSAFVSIAGDIEAGGSDSILFDAGNGTLTKNGEPFTGQGVSVESNTLTLDNVAWTSFGDDTLKVKGDAVIAIIGEVDMMTYGSQNKNVIRGADSDTDLTITGGGDLFLFSQLETIVCRTLTIDGGVSVHSSGPVSVDTLRMINGTLTCQKHNGTGVAISFKTEGTDLGGSAILCGQDPDNDLTDGIVILFGEEYGTIGTYDGPADYVYIHRTAVSPDDDDWYYRQYLERSGGILDEKTSSDDGYATTVAIAASVAGLAVLCAALVIARKD